MLLLRLWTDCKFCVFLPRLSHKFLNFWPQKITSIIIATVVCMFAVTCLWRVSTSGVMDALMEDTYLTLPVGLTIINCVLQDVDIAVNFPDKRHRLYLIYIHYFNHIVNNATDRWTLLRMCMPVLYDLDLQPWRKRTSAWLFIHNISLTQIYDFLTFYIHIMCM